MLRGESMADAMIVRAVAAWQRDELLDPAVWIVTLEFRRQSAGRRRQRSASSRLLLSSEARTLMLLARAVTQAEVADAVATVERKEVALAAARVLAVQTLMRELRHRDSMRVASGRASRGVGAEALAEAEAEAGGGG